MSNTNFSTDFYTERIQALTLELKKYVQRARTWVAIRLTAFLVWAVLVYFLFPYTLFSAIGLVVGFLSFLFFVKKSVENKEKLNFVKRLISINENEINAAHLDYSSFKTGVEYSNSKHPFSYDMDLFGERSFFQFFNRTVTRKGEKKLSECLLYGVPNPNNSVGAIEELSQKPTWYQEYLAYGNSLEEEEADEDLKLLVEEEFKIKKWISIGRYVLPILTISWTACFFLEMVNFMAFLIVAAILMLPIRQTLKTTNRLKNLLDKKSKRVTAMRHQIEIFEKEAFSSPLLVTYYSKIFQGEENGKKGIIQLEDLCHDATYRENAIGGFLINYFLAWDFRLLVKINEWQTKYKANVEEWEKIVYEMEVLISGANYRFNFRNETVAPVLTKGVDGAIEIEGLGHPIIPLKKLVRNNFNLDKKEQFVIITGPNMAGKSTFLRSIGLNLILARAGFHAFAKKFVFPDVHLYSSMRTSDNLKDETSYFHAELLRLRFIVDAIEKGEEVFIILDEILKGTNSKDKREGSAKFVEKLHQLNTRGIIATHDLSLTELSKIYPSLINKYFDTTIEGEHISFDYTIRAGIAENMNASFLLRKMGLIE